MAQVVDVHHRLSIQHSRNPALWFHWLCLAATAGDAIPAIGTHHPSTRRRAYGAGANPRLASPWNPASLCADGREKTKTLDLLVIPRTGGLSGYNLNAAGRVRSGCGYYSVSLSFPVSLEVAPRRRSALFIEVPKRFHVIMAERRSLGGPLTSSKTEIDIDLPDLRLMQRAAQAMSSRIPPSESISEGNVFSGRMGPVPGPRRGFW